MRTGWSRKTGLCTTTGWVVTVVTTACCCCGCGQCKVWLFLSENCRENVVQVSTSLSEKEERRRKKNILAIWQLSGSVHTFVMLVCMCLHLEDEYYIVIKAYKFTTLILANHPGISGTVPETDLASRCPGSVQNCPGNYSHGKRIIIISIQV